MPARVAYDVPRQRTWGWKVSSYIWTKSLAAGGGILAAAAYIFGPGGGDTFDRWFAPALAMAGLILTGILLVADLKRPERFWTILTRPQWRSWLTRGAFIITGYGGLLSLWLLLVQQGNGRILTLLAWPLGMLAVLTAIYTAFLFAQCEGRDLWQDRRVLVHLVLHALIAGLAAELVAAPLIRGTVITDGLTDLACIMALAAFAIVGMGDAFSRHATANAAAAAHQLTRGRQAVMFWTSIIGGAVLPALLLMGGWPATGPLAGGLALTGLWLHSHALVLAGQGPPIS